MLDWEYFSAFVLFMGGVAKGVVRTPVAFALFVHVGRAAGSVTTNPLHASPLGCSMGRRLGNAHASSFVHRCFDRIGAISCIQVTMISVMVLFVQSIAVFWALCRGLCCRVPTIQAMCGHCADHVRCHLWRVAIDTVLWSAVWRDIGAG